MELMFIGIGFLTAFAGALLMRSRDRLGRIVLVFGATLVMAGTGWQAVAALL
jgi:hypothetical protein